MKRSLKTLLNYAEQQADYVEDLDQLVVCFAQSTDVRCVLLLDGLREKPCDEMWQSFLRAESIEEAMSNTHDGEGASCHSDVQFGVTEGQILDGGYKNILKLSPQLCELSCTDQEPVDEMQNENPLNSKRRKLDKGGVFEKVVDCSIDNAVQMSQSLLVANSDQHAIESTILLYSNDSNNTELNGPSSTKSNPDPDPDADAVMAVYDSAENGKGPDPAVSDGKVVEVSRSDSAHTLAVMHSPNSSLHLDAGITNGADKNPSITLNSLPQQQYRPLQNSAPPASTYIPDVLPSSTVQLSYYQFQEMQQKERIDRAMKEKTTAAASSKGIEQISALASKTDSFSNDCSSSSSSGNTNSSIGGSSSSSSSSIKNKNGSSSSSSSSNNNSNTLHSTNSFSVQHRSPVAGLDPQTLPQGTMHSPVSYVQTGQSSIPSMGSMEMTEMQTGQGTHQMTGLASDGASSEQASGCGSGCGSGSGSRVDQQDPLRFSEWPSWIWSRTFCYPLPSTAVIAAAGNDAGKVVYWMQQTIRLEDNLAFEAAIMLSNRVCLPLIVVYVTDAGSHRDLRNLSVTAKEQAGKKNGETQEGLHGVQGIHLSQQSYMRKSLTTYSILESLSRSLRGLKIPLVCLTEGSAPVPMHPRNKNRDGDQDEATSSRTATSTNSTNSNSTRKESRAELHPTVSVLVDFFCSLPSSAHTGRSDTVNGRPTNSKSAVAAEETLERRKCGVFALFTDDAHHPMSVHVTASLVARLPQLPVFCMDSNSVIPPSSAVGHYPGQFDPVAEILDPPKGERGDTVASEDIMRTFKSHCDAAAVQYWNFGSKILTTALDDCVGGQGIGQGSAQYQACFFQEFSFSGIQGNEEWMDWATVKDLLGSPHCTHILAACESHMTKKRKGTQNQGCSAMKRCKEGVEEDDDVIIAGLMLGTVSPRKAILRVFPSLKGREECGAAVRGVDDPSDEAQVMPANANGSGDEDGSKACDESSVEALKYYLLQSDMLRYCCYSAMKDGLLTVERVPVHATAVAATAPRVAPHNAFRKGQDDGTRNTHRAGSNGKNSSGSSSSSSSSSSGASKWTVPWLRLLSPRATSALRKANNAQGSLGFVYPVDIRGASTDDDQFNRIQSVLMLHGIEPRGEKARYWVRFFLTHMGSRILGLRTAIAELSVHSNKRVESYGDLVMRLLYETSIVLRDMG